IISVCRTPTCSASRRRPAIVAPHSDRLGAAKPSRQLHSLDDRAKVPTTEGISEGIPHLTGEGFWRLQSRLGARIRLAFARTASCAVPVGAGPTPEEYVGHVGGGAKVRAAGQVEARGQPPLCG